MRPIVEMRDGVYRVAGTRVSLNSIVEVYHEGLSPETISEECFDLTVDEVRGAIEFYLANKAAMDEYIAEYDRIAELNYQAWRAANPDLIAKMQRLRLANQIPSGR